MCQHWEAKHFDGFAWTDSAAPCGIQTSFPKGTIQDRGHRCYAFFLSHTYKTIAAKNDYINEATRTIVSGPKKQLGPITMEALIKEQELQTRHFIDEKTAVSNTHNLGLSLLVIPEITKDGSLSIQVIDADNSSIKYITIRDF